MVQTCSTFLVSQTNVSLMYRSKQNDCCGAVTGDASCGDRAMLDSIVVDADGEN